MLLRRPKKSALLSRVSLGTWITIPHPSVAELMVRAGFDWVVVDLEHSPIGIESAAELIRTIDLAGSSPFVRVGSHDANVIKRVMDAGAHGVIASTVNTPEQAAAIVSAVKYPPLGTRGVGLSRAQGYAEEFESHYTSRRSGISNRSSARRGLTASSSGPTTSPPRWGFPGILPTRKWSKPWRK